MRQLLIRYRISLALKIFATLLLLSVVWVYNPELPAGEVAGEWYWLAQTGILYAVIMLAAVILYRDRKKSTFPEYYYIIIWSFIFLAGVEAVWGIMEYLLSGGIAGSFHSTELFSGYMAVMFPICLNEWLETRSRRKKTILRQAKYYTSLIALTFILVATVFTHIYTAWLSLVIASLFVLWHHFRWKEKIVSWWHNDKKKFLQYSAIGVFVLLSGSISLYFLERENIDKQVFLTRMSFKTLAERPLTGYGPEAFTHAYGTVQEKYFEEGTWSEYEEGLAETPEHPGNEYIHGAIEWGIPIMLSVLVFIGLALRQGIKYGRYSASAGIIALLVFSFFSAPMQIPTFVISMVFLLAACIMGRQRIWLAGLAIIIGLFGIHWWRMDDYYLCKEWSRHQRLYHVAAYDAASKGYQQLYDGLKHKKKFMYEYAHCLYETKEYDASLDVLQESCKNTCNPMVYNLIGKNHQRKGQYKEAEYWYKKAANLVPGKMYPYYLLAKLYDEPDFRQPAKCKEMAKKVLEKEKTNKTVIARQMRDEARKLNNLVSNNKTTFLPLTFQFFGQCTYTKPLNND